MVSIQYNYDCVVFDLEGVISNTIQLQKDAWKHSLNAYLERRNANPKPHRVLQKPFVEQDFYPYLDGRPLRDDAAVRLFLGLRGIKPNEGKPNDHPENNTVFGVCHAKHLKFVELINTKGLESYSFTIKLMKDLKAKGIPMGLATDSIYARQLLSALGLDSYFTTIVDGSAVAELGLRNKPFPDIVATAVQNMGCSPGRAVLIEATEAGCGAGQAAKCRLVVGIARIDNSFLIKNAGAHIVVPDLDGYCSADSLNTWIRHGTASKSDPIQGLGPTAPTPSKASPRASPRSAYSSPPPVVTPTSNGFTPASPRSQMQSTQLASPRDLPAAYKDPSPIASPRLTPGHGRRATPKESESTPSPIQYQPPKATSGSSTLRPLSYQAVLFDFENVFADVATYAELALRLTIDDCLLTRQDRLHEPFFEFESKEYKRFFSGVSRLDGMRTFLASRKISLPEGTDQDRTSDGTVHAMAKKAHAKFVQLLEQHLPRIGCMEASIQLAQDLKRKGLKVGCVAMSEKARDVLSDATVKELFDVLLERKDALHKSLREYPEVDLWMTAAQSIGVPISKCVLVGHSQGSLQAARKAGPAFVIGVRPGEENDEDEGEKKYGADMLLKDFHGYATAEHIQRWIDTTSKYDQGPTADLPESLQMVRRGTIVDIKPMDLFSAADWSVEETEYNEQSNQLSETIYCLCNGFVAMRGSFEEGYHGALGKSVPGTYMNGFYESSPIKYAEAAYGYPEKHQTMLNVTNCKSVTVTIPSSTGRSEVNMFSGEISDYKRSMSLREGVVTRKFKWTNNEEQQVQVNVMNMISFEDKHLAIMRYEVTPLNFDGEIRITTTVEGYVTNITGGSDPRVGSALSGPTLIVINKNQQQNGAITSVTSRTTYSNLVMCCATKTCLETRCQYRIEGSVTENAGQTVYIVQAQRGEPITMVKYAAYHNSRDTADQTALVKNAISTSVAASEQGIPYWLGKQSAFLTRFWDQCNVEIAGDPSLQQGVRFNMLHLLMSVGRDGKTNIGAKGLTGEGYEGHYFWDTEIYIFPFFLYTMPDIARKLLEFRYGTLDGARNRAKELDHKGALFPWRTIMGDEASAYFPAGTAQYHINADIIFSLRRYMEATDDTEFLTRMGAEMLFETARFWLDIGNFRVSDGKFVINMVTGPDEYTALINNNCFTNMMARNNLSYAYDIAQRMKSEFPQDFDRLSKQLKLASGEPDLWKKAANEMFLPYDEQKGIFCQDDSFLNKERWDVEGTPKDKFPLLLNYHPLSIYRKQVCKQADLLLAEFLLGDQFSLEQKKRDYEFYEPVTTHDSSLSACVFAILAAELGHKEKAYTHFAQTARMDLDNHHHNTQHGIHTACMAGTWLSLVSGFGGMRTYNGKLSFNPWVPDAWDGYSFNIVFRGSTISINATKAGTTYKLNAGNSISFLHQNTMVTLSSVGDTVQRRAD